MKPDWKTIAEFMLRYEPGRLLQPPASIGDLEREARESLALAAQRQPFDFHNVACAVEDTLRFLMAARKPGIVGAADLIVYCLRLKDRLDETIGELKKDERLARVIRNVQLSTKHHAERFRGTGTRGLKMSAPRNRIVTRLFDYMVELRERWLGFVPAEERENFRSTLHPTVQEIVSLPPLSRKSALRYHRVGRAILRDAAGKKDFTYHPAFAERGEFHTLAKQAKTLDGPLNEAWRELAKMRQRDGKKTEKRQDSRKVR